MPAAGVRYLQPLVYRGLQEGVQGKTKGQGTFITYIISKLLLPSHRKGGAVFCALPHQKYKIMIKWNTFEHDCLVNKNIMLTFALVISDENYSKFELIIIRNGVRVIRTPFFLMR